jgi:hypothetical protein
MGWRDTYKVHPAADVFPMMSDEELDALGKDIEANGLRHSLLFYQHNCTGAGRLLIDGRNRLEAIERLGLKGEWPFQWTSGDPVPRIISANIHRRHLTKEQKADLIVAAHKAAAEAEAKLDQVEPVSTKGGRGKKNPIKGAILADTRKAGISDSTAKRAIAKPEGKTPAQKAAKTRGANRRAQLKAMKEAMEGSDRSIEVEADLPIKRRRRTDAEIERDKFLVFLSTLEFGNPKVGDSALDLLTKEDKADAMALGAY